MQTKRAISPVLPTLITSIVIAGFVFGLFGTFAPPPNPCNHSLPQIIHSSAAGWVVHNGTNPNGTSWVLWHNCDFEGYRVIGTGQYANGTTWWATRKVGG